ncbi:unnamed protein product [Clonostachys rosea]|uniref:F-box domain-containing protein n=1 Tax=Bionectria ochroleuca TaxID=29856 RepID=A0ABY6V3T3_BIOOC|nr:unnamed protein product [Clonostachys rosea]
MDAPVSEIDRVDEYQRLTAPTDVNRMAIYTRPDNHESVQGWLFTVFSAERPSVNDLGILQRLPNEVIQYIVKEMTVRTAFDFSHANRAAREAIDGCIEYQEVRRHALASVWALLQTDLGNCTKITGVHSALLNRNCGSCGQIGQLMFLPTTERVCLSCLQTKPDYLVHSLDTVHSWFSDQGLEVPKGPKPALGTFLCPPGFYDIEEKPKELRKKFMSDFHAVQFAEANGVEFEEYAKDDGSDAYLEPNDLEPLDGAGDPYLPEVDVMEIQIWYRSSDGSYQPRPEDDHVEPLLATCGLPYYNRRLGLTLEGQACRGCIIFSPNLDGEERLAAEYTVYLLNEFWEHFQTCDRARRLMEIGEAEFVQELTMIGEEIEEESEGEVEGEVEEEMAEGLPSLREESDEELPYGEYGYEYEYEEEQTTCGEEMPSLGGEMSSLGGEIEEEQISDSEYVTADEF